MMNRNHQWLKCHSLTLREARLLYFAGATPDTPKTDVEVPKDAPISDETMDRIRNSGTNEELAASVRGLQAEKVAQAKQSLQVVADEMNRVSKDMAAIKEKLGKDADASPEMTQKKAEMEQLKGDASAQRETIQEQRDQRKPPRTQAEAKKRAFDDALEDLKDPTLGIVDKFVIGFSAVQKGFDWIMNAANNKPFTPEAQNETDKEKKEDETKIQNEAKDAVAKRVNDPAAKVGEIGGKPLADLIAEKGPKVKEAEDSVSNLEKGMQEKITGWQEAKASLQQVADNPDATAPEKENAEQELAELTTEMQTLEKQYEEAVKNRDTLQREKKVLEEQKKIVDEINKEPGSKKDNMREIADTPGNQTIEFRSDTFYYKLVHPPYTYRITKNGQQGVNNNQSGEFSMLKGTAKVEFWSGTGADTTKPPAFTLDIKSKM